jgi:transcriptional regulator GlxA family with amidase domain
MNTNTSLDPSRRRFLKTASAAVATLGGIAAGVSAGIDMPLELVALTNGEETARMVQLIVEYDPQPPFDSDCRRTASPEQVAAARQRLIEIYAQPKEAL